MREIIQFEVSEAYQSVYMSAPTIRIILYHTQNAWIAQLDPQIPARSMESCAKYGSIDCAARSMDCTDPQIAPNVIHRYPSCTSLRARADAHTPVVCESSILTSLIITLRHKLGRLTFAKA